MSLTFAEAEHGFLSILSWVESWGTTPREKIDLDGMAAVARIAGRIKRTLSTPQDIADLQAIGRMIAQDAPTMVAPPPPADDPPAVGYVAPAHQSPADFNAESAQ
jgi:hypothetical protein